MEPGLGAIRVAEISGSRAKSGGQSGRVASSSPSPNLMDTAAATRDAHDNECGSAAPPRSARWVAGRPAARNATLLGIKGTLSEGCTESLNRAARPLADTAGPAGPAWCQCVAPRGAAWRA